jgi:hypothetical protein
MADASINEFVAQYPSVAVSRQLSEAQPLNLL